MPTVLEVSNKQEITNKREVISRKSTPEEKRKQNKEIKNGGSESDSRRVRVI